MQKSYYRCLLAVLAAYVLGYGALLLWTGGLPYVLDNNESFSSLCHAYNLYHFDFWKTYGVTDEACSPHAAAHPYLYTHEGNFPRLFAFLLFVLGARGIESQIVVTTLTVGTAAIFFAYHFFGKLAGPRFALLACLFLMTDYLFFAQWQVVTWRVWHAFFLFSSLLCAQGIGEGRRGWWTALTFLNYLCLFYWELVFVSFVTLTAALYTAALWRRSPAIVGRAAAAALAGALTSVLVCFAQLVAVLGLPAVLADARFTFLARNFAGRNFRLPAEVSTFYDTHHIVFLRNFVDGRPYLRPGACWASFFTYNLGPYTPLFAAVVLILLCALLVGLLYGRRSPGAGARRRLARLAWPRERLGPAGRLALRLGAFLFLWFCADHLLAALLRDQAYAGSPPDSVSPAAGRSLLAWAIHGAACGLVLLLNRCATNRWWGYARIPLLRVVAAGCAMLAVAWSLRRQHGWYGQQHEPIWAAILKTGYARAAARLALVSAVSVAGILLLGGYRLLRREDRRPLRRLGRYLACGMVAYFVVYGMFPGYLHSVILRRYVSFFVFFSNACIAVAAYFVLRLLGREAARARRSGCLRFADPRTGASGVAPLESVGRALLAPPVLRAVPLALLLAFVGTYWVRLQVFYVRALRPDYYDFLRVLRAPPYRGASFITNVYAPPIAAATGQWAYCDCRIAGGCVQLGRAGYLVERDLIEQLWLADRGTNPAYTRPDYILLVQSPDMGLVAARLAPGRPGLPPPEPSWPIASPSGLRYLEHRVVAQDPSGRGRWQILKADWDYPPYLLPQTEEVPPRHVRLEIATTHDGLEARVQYRYAQQEGKPEAGTVVRLYAVDLDGESRLLDEVTGQTAFRLPSSFAGNLKASVTPATATKRGPECFSDTRRVGNAPSVRPPYLRPLPGRVGSCVGLSLVAGNRGDAIRLEYQYCHDEGEPESGSIARLYLEDRVGQLTLLQEARGGKEVPVPSPLPYSVRPDPSLAFRVSLTPRTAASTGREYFCPDRVPVASFARPFLVPFPDPQATRVQVDVRSGTGPTALALNYAYAHPSRARECGTVVRLYAVDDHGSLALLREEKDTRLLLLDPGFRGKVRVSVTPGTGNISGPEYFSDTVAIED
jgi:hypothetical protein